MGLNKRGAISKVDIYLMDAVFLAVIIIIFLVAISSLRESTSLEREFISKDMGLAINALYASPNTILYAYPNDLSMFSVKFEKNLVKISVNSNPDLESKNYPFVEEQDVVFAYKEIGKTANVDEISRIVEIGFLKNYRKAEPSPIILTSNVLTS